MVARALLLFIQTIYTLFIMHWNSVQCHKRTLLFRSSFEGGSTRAPIFGRWIMYIATVNCPATWAATVCLRGLTNVCCTSVCPISGIRCVQTMVFLCSNNGISVSKQWYFCVSKQWYLVCPNNGISVCPNSGIFVCPNNGISVCPNSGIFVCPNNGMWCVQTMVFDVFK